MTMHEPRLPPPSFLYPSPTSSDPTLPSPYGSGHQQQHPPPHPAFSRSESTPQLHQRPPNFRTTTSPINQRSGNFEIKGPVGMVRSNSKSEEDEREELTTKGRKRKRLAKACSACHKNKRRCDGFAPCSNCEFSSRPCLYVNAQGEVIPPPRTREAPVSSSKKESDKVPPTPEKRDNDSRKDDSSPRKDLGENHRRGFVDPLEAVDKDPSLSAELINIFFNRIHPYGAMFHSPTFHHRLYLGQTSPLLLDSIYALAAHLCSDSSFLETLSPNMPSWARGEAFAERAHHTAKRLIDIRAGWNEEEKRIDRGTWEETEFTQALYLLSVYFASIRQSSLGLYFLDVAIDILRPTSTATLPPPAPHLTLSTIEYLTLMEARNRTFWMLVLHDLCAAANGRPRRLMDHEMYNVPLPGDEAQWERWGGGGSTGREGGRRDGLAVGTGNWPGEEGQVGELGHVLRILAVFSDIMTVANNGGPGSDTRGNPAQHEQALKAWALSLPRQLRFDEHTLSMSVARLNNPVQTISRSGWLFAYMHAVAECGMFYLQAALASTGASWTAQRQSQAVDNIAVILEAINARGRESPLMLFPLLVVSNWHDHLRSSPAPPTTQQMLLEDRLDLWWSEASRDWGFDRSTTTDRGLYPNNIRRPPSPLHLQPNPPQGLGLYSTSPPSHAPDSAISTASTITLPTPKPSYHRYSQPQLPPLRPRANTLQFPSESPRHRYLPSMSAFSDPHSEIKLPPLVPPLDPSPKLNGQSYRFPPFFDRPDFHRQSADGRDSGSGSTSTRDRERDRDRTSPSPRFNPYWRTDRLSSSPNLSTSTSTRVKEERRPVSPLSKPWRDDVIESERNERSKEKNKERERSGPVGIAALVSAAEAKSKEREEGNRGLIPA